MILHDVNFSKFDIRQEDTLEHPQHAEFRFEAIVANPPFSAQWSANPLHLQDDRFSQYGRLAPSSKADYAFIQHMIYQLDENGTMAVVMPHGVLFRGGAEEQIRKFLIKEKNYLDAVIGLPANLFFGTGIPACILVFKKCRENPDNVVFIDSSQHCVSGKNQNILRDEDIEMLVSSYFERKNIDKYCQVILLDEIEKNGYNLNIPRYVTTYEEEVELDINKVSADLAEIASKELKINTELKKFTDELGIKAPF